MRARHFSLLVLAGLAMWQAPHVAHAADVPPVYGPRSELARALIDDSRIILHVRNYLLDRYEDGPGPGAWALGGWLGYETGWFADVLKLGAIGYTSQPLWAPEDRDGTELLMPGQKGYTVLGQAYATLRFADQQLTLYRQLVNEPEVNPQDSRMTPNTFEGAMFYGTAGPVRLHAGLLTAMKLRDADQFVNMAEAAGAAGTSDMYLASIALPELGAFSARASIYSVPNLLTSAYADGNVRIPLGEETSLRLSGQFMYQTAVGEDLLTGPDFQAWVGGILGEVEHRGLTLRAGYTANGSDDEWQAPYGAWPGYTHMILKDFDREGEKALLLGGTLDLGAAGLEGLSLTADAAIDLAVAAGQQERNEYDFTADYRFAAIAGGHEWLAPLQLRLRYALLDPDAADDQSDETTDFRVILNYEWVPHGERDAPAPSRD